MNPIINLMVNNINLIVNNINLIINSINNSVINAISSNEFIIEQKNQINEIDVRILPILYNFLNIFILYIILDIFIRIIFIKQTRWFILHFIVNFIIVINVYDDLFTVFKNPIMGFTKTPTYTALNMVVVLHVYHILFFRGLLLIDWIHHILMVFTGIVAYTCVSPVIICSNALLFFICGLPGCIDYMLLTFVKYKLINPLTEKLINSYLNICIRSPGIIIATYILYLTTIFTNYELNIFLTVLILSILFWNAQYFTYRVISNYNIKKTEKLYNHKHYLLNLDD